MVEVIGGITYGPAVYDANGNLTSDGTNTYTYDSENRLLSATTPSSTTAYTYDPFGRRIFKTIDTTTTEYLYDGDQVICEYDGAGTLTTKYIYGSGIDEPLLLDDGANKYYYHFDALGSVTTLTDSNGDLTEEYSYDIFGKVTGSFSECGNPYYFTGRRYDDETGLYYYRARMYDPRLGRFLQTDVKTWQPNDSRILQKSKDLSEFFESIFLVFPHLQHTDKELSQIKKSVIQRFDQQENNTRLLEYSIDEKLVRIFIQLQGKSNPRILHPYTYCFNNPVNYCDPKGEYVFVIGIGWKIVAGIVAGVLIITEIVRYKKKWKRHPETAGPAQKPYTPPPPQPYHPPGR